MNVWQFLLNASLSFYLNVFYFMSCLDISDWKALLIKPTTCNFFSDRRDDERIKHNAKCLNFYFYTVSCRINKSGTPGQFWVVSQWRCWNFCLIWICCKLIFLVHFFHQVAHGEKTFISYLQMKNNKRKHKRKNTMRTTEETVNSTYFSSKRRVQHDFHRQLSLQHSLES